MKSTHCSTRRGANRGPNFFSNWTVSSKRWPNIPANRWSKHYLKNSCTYEESSQTISVSSRTNNLIWPESRVPSDCYLLTGCSSCSWNHSNSLSRNCTDSHTSQTHISPSPSFRFWHLAPPWNRSCTNKEQRWTAVTDEAAQTNSGQWRSACCDRAGLLTTASVSWRQIYSGLRAERQTPHTTEPERVAGGVNMR